MGRYVVTAVMKCGRARLEMRMRTPMYTGRVMPTAGTVRRVRVPAAMPTAMANTA